MDGNPHLAGVIQQYSTQILGLLQGSNNSNNGVVTNNNNPANIIELLRQLGEIVQENAKGSGTNTADNTKDKQQPGAAAPAPPPPPPPPPQAAAVPSTQTVAPPPNDAIASLAKLVLEQQQREQQQKIEQQQQQRKQEQLLQQMLLQQLTGTIQNLPFDGSLLLPKFLHLIRSFLSFPFSLRICLK